jgi:cytochrome c
MKKISILLFVATVLFACNSNDNKEKKDDVVDITKNPDYQKGVQLVANSDCLTCHRPDEKIQGPSYKDVANKYASYPDTIIGHLAKKIIRGGNDNVWDVPGTMNPHPSLSEDDAKSMVKYILLLKK